MTLRHPFMVAAVFLGACGQAVPPLQPEPPKAEKAVEAAAPRKSDLPRQAETPPKTQTPPKPDTPPPVASAPSPPRPSAAPAKPAASVVPPKPPAQAAAVRPPPPTPAAKPPAPEPVRASPAPLDLKSLESRLKDTGAIGVLTKLSLKNQVDDLIDRFLAFHDGKRPPMTLSELRPAYELLLMKVLSLLQDKDAPLAHDINASREAIWSLLADGQKLARYK